MCVSIAGSNGISWSWEIEGDTLIQTGKQPVTWYSPAGIAIRQETHTDVITHNIPSEARIIRIMGGQGIVWNTGYDYFRKEGERWVQLEREE